MDETNDARGLKGAHTIDLEARQSLRNFSLEHGRAIGIRCCVKSKILLKALWGKDYSRHMAARISLATFMPGTVGILLIAKQKGSIESVKEVLDDLIANGTYISKKLYQQALATIGE